MKSIGFLPCVSSAQKRLLPTSLFRNLGLMLACLLLLVSGETCAYAQTASFSYAIQSLGSGLSYPQGVAVDASGNVFVADTSNNVVKKIPYSGGSYGTPVTLGTGFSNPTGVAVDGSGNVFVADYGNNAVKKIPYSGGSYGTPVTLTTGFSNPTGVAVDGSGNVFVADTSNNAVKKIPYSGGSYGTPVTLGTGFSNPIGVAVDGSGNVFVADTDNDAVKKVPYSGGSYGAPVILATGFHSPTGVAVDGSGNVFVADFNNNAVKEIPYSGGSYGTPVTLGSGFSAPWGVAVDDSGNIFVADTFHSAVKKIITRAVTMPGTAIGQSSSLTLTFTFATGGTIGAPVVLTMGAPNLDFTDAGTGSCTTNGTTHSYSAGNICTVDVTFGPKYAGLRSGAVELTTTAGAVIATAYISATGMGPQIAFRPGTQSTLGSGVNPVGVAVDGSSNVFIADYSDGTVKKVPYSGGTYGTPVMVGSGFAFPYGTAVDGSGNIFVADTLNNAVKKIPYSGGSYGTPVTAGSGFLRPESVAVDSNGNIFVADTLNNAVKKIPYSGGVYGTPVTVGSGFLRPYGVAVDGNGNVFVADTSNNAVKEILYSGGSYGTTVTLGSGFNQPVGVTVDGNSNVFVSDYGNNALKEIPYSGGSYDTPVIVSASPIQPFGVAVDGSGNVFFANSGNHTVQKLDFADAPGLNFASTVVGSTSSDSPQTVTVLNIGNADLSFPIPNPTGNNPSISTGFTWNSSASGACPEISSSASSAGTLAAGSSCALSISFTPTTAGTISGALTLKDNALNASYATQGISLNGTASSLPTVTGVSPNSGTSLGGTNVTITGTDLTGTTAVSFGATAATNVSVVNATTVIATSPVGSGTVDITVTTPDGTSAAVSADRFTYNQDIGSFVIAGLGAGTAGTAQTITVTAKSSGGSTNTGYTGMVHFASSDTQAVLPSNYTFTASDNGVHTFSVTLKTSGSQSVSVQDTVTTSATGTANATISAGAAASYFLDAPSAVPFYTAFSFNAYARDAYGNTATSYNGTAVMSSSDPGFSNLGPFTFANGTTTVYSAFKTAGNETLTLADTFSPSVTGTATLYMAPGPVQALTVSSPSSTTAGQAVSVTVTAHDLFNNTVNGYTGTIHFSSTDTRASLPGSFTFSPADNGTHTFSATLRTPGSQTIKATDAVNSVSGTSAQITVTMPLLVVTTAADDAGTASNCTLQTTRATGTDSSCSLRDALLEAATLGIADITFDTTQFSTAKTIAVSYGTLTIPAYTTITGATSGSGLTQMNLVTVDGGGSANNFSIFTAGSGVTGSTIRNLIITNGYVNSQGGAINNSGALTVTDCTFSNNYAGGYVASAGNGGGAIYNSAGTLTISNSTFTGNTSSPGGAISLVSGTAAISNSTFFGNTAESTYAGGAIFVNTGAALTVSNSTFSSNAAAGGGAIMNYGTLAMTNSIIANSSGGGLLNSGTMTVSNSLIGANFGSNCGGAGCPTNGVNGNNIGASGVLLTVLGSRGGPTQTILPTPGSPAICLGSASYAAGANITSDQRGVAMNLNSSNASAYTGVGGYCPAGSIDAGAVQTNYALSFSTQPSGAVQNATMSPAPAVTLKENGATFTASSVTIPLTLTSIPAGAALSGGSASTSAGIATYNSLKVDAAGTADTLTAALSLPSISATSSSFAVTSSLTATQQVVSAFLTKNFTITPFTPVTGSGGTGALAYSISPALPAGLSLSASTGTLSGTPTVTSTTTTYTVTVTDANGATASKTFALTVNGPVSATTVIASVGLTVQNPVAGGIIPVSGSGGVGTLHYTVSPALPAGVAMNSTTGALSGLPTATGPITTYTVTVTDANNATATATFTLSVNPPVSATTAIASVVLTQNHAATAFTPVTGSGGTAPLSYSVIPVLPAGLSMASSTGAVSGTPAAVSSATTYTVTVTDANGTTDSKSFSLTVNAPVVATQLVASATLTYGMAATAFTPVTGSGGTGTLTYSVSPALPSGLSMSAAGVVSGTPFAVQTTASYTVTVRDTNGATASNTFTLAVNKATPTITTEPTVGAITYGQTLASSTLTGGIAMFNGNPVAGSFSWTTPTTAPGAGTPSESITFTPTDTASHSAVTGTVAVTVNKAAVTITWPVPSNIVYGTALSATQLNATASVAGSFTYTLAAGTVLTVGAHTLSVNFTPTDTSNYASPVASTVNLSVTAAPLTVVVDSASRIYGAANPALTGTATGLVNGDTAASVGLSYATTATQSSGVGPFPITASITSTNYALSVTQGMLTVTGATLTVTANNATKIYGTANPIFSGSLAGQQNGDTFTASYSTTATTNSPVTTYAIVPSVTGTNLNSYTVNKTNGTLTITQAASRVALASSATSITPGQSLTLTATATDATPGSTGTPTGTITFLNGTAVLGTATLANGVASFTTNSLAPGATYALSARYGGDTNFAGSTANSGVSITVASLDFTITPPTNLNPTVMPGGTVQTSFSITSWYGAFAGPVSFTAAGLPTGAMISFSPSSIPANSSGTQTITMTIKLPATTARNQQGRPGSSVPPIALGLLLLPLAGMRRVRKSALLRITLLSLLSGAGVGALTGCGTGNGFNATASQNYTVTVTATAGSLSHNFQINLNVQ